MGRMEWINLKILYKDKFKINIDELVRVACEIEEVLLSPINVLDIDEIEGCRSKADRIISMLLAMLHNKDFLKDNKDEAQFYRLQRDLNGLIVRLDEIEKDSILKRPEFISTQHKRAFLNEIETLLKRDVYFPLLNAGQITDSGNKKDLIYHIRHLVAINASSFGGWKRINPKRTDYQLSEHYVELPEGPINKNNKDPIEAELELLRKSGKI